MPHAPDLSGHALDDRYELHAMIGEGAFGRVYRGLDRRLARPVAVKVIKPWWTDDPDWVASFEREAQLLARVSDPGIVQIFDVGHAAEGLYYVSELVDGESLARRLRRGPLGPWNACEISAQLCRALAHAHSKGIIHRDVKPANILLSAQGQVKVGDFGVARLAEGSTDGAAATIVGTPKYMAPEQGQGLPTTPATDVYSVGVVLYEMLAGSAPFSGGTAVELALRHLQESPAPLPEALPAELVRITARALAKDPADRYADGADMADALLRARRRASGRQLTGVGARADGRQSAVALAPAGREHGEAGVALADGEVRTRPANVRTRSTAQSPRRRVAAHAIGDGRSADAGATAALIAPAEPRVTRARTEAPAPGRGPDQTRLAPRMSRRRNVNPPARRRAAAAFALVLVLLGAMVAAGMVTGHTGRTRVPSFTGLDRAAVSSLARRDHVGIVFGSRYASAHAGLAVAQHPSVGTQVADGASVNVILSRGRAPVEVPLVVQENAGNAQTELRGAGLASVTRQVPAPGITPGTVTRQLPTAGSRAAANSTVVLSVAETPQWRPLTTFTGGRSVAFRILGDRWRIVYRMAFQGMCTFIFFCSGPNAHVADLSHATAVSDFGLSDGSDQTRMFSSGPGLYQITVTRGSDSAQWFVEVEDYY